MAVSCNKTISFCSYLNTGINPVICALKMRLLLFKYAYYKQLLDEVFVMSGIIKVEVSVISRSRRLRLITLTETLIIPDITKTESNSCWIIHSFKQITKNAFNYAEEANQPAMFLLRCAWDASTRGLDMALGNRALRAQPTDYSLVCKFFNNLYINCTIFQN